jgi:protein-L-isoaspartate(D-aspartate) O-methyltransferase
MINSSNFKKQRQAMVEEQLKPRGITDQKILAAFLSVPREKFVEKRYQELSYTDSALPAGYKQTISQPYVVAKMVQLLQINQEDTVLDIGTGSGYQAAILSRLAKQVISVEIVSQLAAQAQKTFKELGYNNIQVIVGDGKKGYQTKAPYDGIIAAAVTDAIPLDWKRQLKINKRIVAPLKDRLGQRLIVLTKKRNGWEKENFDRVIFVPLV